jgi:hypothetical protein
MALIAHFKPTNMDQATYAEVMRRLDAAGAGSPLGRLHHVCYGPADRLCVTDVFDTAHHFESFGKTLLPILAALGVDAGPPEVREVHNIVRG